MLKESPQNAQFALRLAVINDQLFKDLQANEATDSSTVAIAFAEVVENYKSVLAIKPKDLTANFNLAMLYTQSANNYYKTINELTLTEYKSINSKQKNTKQRQMHISHKLYHIRKLHMLFSLKAQTFLGL